MHFFNDSILVMIFSICSPSWCVQKLWTEIVIGSSACNFLFMKFIGLLLICLQLQVLNCHDSVIYILAPLRYATVYGCSDATIVLGAVGKVTPKGFVFVLWIIDCCNGSIAGKSSKFSS